MKKMFFAAIVLLTTFGVLAQEPQPAGEGGGRNQDPWAAGTFTGFRLRAVGPALMSGRVNNIAVHPGDKQTWYVGVASGGVWKTTNAGITWTPVWQNEGSYSVGAVVIDQKNPGTIWVGSGEGNNQRSVGYGDGIYRSDDAGRTWRNLGLKTSEHINRIVIDPRDSNVVFAAAYGPLWTAGGDRGLYKTADGGKTWRKITAGIPATMAVGYLILLIYFRAIGGYKLVEIGPGGKEIETSHEPTAQEAIYIDSRADQA